MDYIDGSDTATPSVKDVIKFPKAVMEIMKSSTS